MDKTDNIRDTLRGLVAQESALAPQDVEDDVNLGEYGVDSMAATSLIGRMEKLLDTHLSPTLIYEAPTIDELADAIEEAVRSADG